MKIFNFKSKKRIKPEKVRESSIVLEEPALENHLCELVPGGWALCRGDCTNCHLFEQYQKQHQKQVKEQK